MSVNDTVVVLHGLWMHGTETVLLRRRLTRAGFNAIAFSYRSVSEDLDRNAARLAHLIEDLPGRHHLVGHSLGGVVMVAMAGRYALPNVGRLVCLGAPLAGCAAARSFARWPGGETLLGRSHEALSHRQPLLPPEHSEVGMIAGDFPVGLGRLFTDLGGPNDGTVAVSETCVPGLADHIVLSVSHLAMLWSDRVADQTIAFIREGRFEPAS